MSERITDDWGLYEVASDLEMWERLGNFHLSNEEKKLLLEYRKIYEKHLDLNRRVLSLKEKLPPHPQINEVTIEYKELRQESESLDKEIQRLVNTAPLQNVLNYRFPNRSSFKPQINRESVQKAIINHEELGKKEARHKKISSIKEKLSNTFGIFGGIMFVVVRLIVSVLPFVMIGGNFLLTLLLISINTFVPFASAVFWIWGLICAINGVQDVWAIIYYIVFVVVWIPFYISTIISVFSKGRRN